MERFWKGFKKIANKTRKKLTTYDGFGVPITVNYKGDDSYRTFVGFIFTFLVTGVMLAYSYQAVTQMVNREEPDRAYYKLTNSRSEDDALNLPEQGGQMYIGLSQKVELKDGTTIYTFIDFDQNYINSKIDYYERGRLVARKNLDNCTPEDLNDFTSKVQNTNGLLLDDFIYMRCIPRDTFSLYNVAGSNEVNSITLHFEQCGGKFAKPKEFPAEVEKQNAILTAQGATPDQLIPTKYVWTKQGCEVGSKDAGCDLGLSDTPEEEALKEAAKDQYTDCDPLIFPKDIDCVETWTFPSDCVALGKYACYKKMTNNACTLRDSNCYVGFLRAMCASPAYQDRVCDTQVFREALRKESDWSATARCLPGQRRCTGFQAMFGGPKSDNSESCLPWDFDCALQDYFVASNRKPEHAKYPLLYDMEKTTLTIQENNDFMETTQLLDMEIWKIGLNSPDTLSPAQQEAYYALGSRIMTVEGFAAFYQGLKITQKLQEIIDSSFRAFALVTLNTPLDTEFMPLTSVTALEFREVLAWVKDTLDGSEIFEKGIFYKDVLPSDIDKLYSGGATFLGDAEVFKSALYEQKRMKKFQQVRIDAAVRSFLDLNKRIAKDSFPWTKISDEDFNDILRAIQLAAVDDFDTLLSNQMPTDKFNIDVRIFKPTPAPVETTDPVEISDPVQTLIGHFVTKTSPLTELQQIVFDNQLRKFLTTNQRIVETDKTQVIKVDDMPDTELTVREYAELQRLQQKEYSDLFERGLSNKEISLEDQKKLLETGEAMYGKEGINALYFFRKEITANTQVTIDEYIRRLIKGLKKAVLPGLPETTLTEYELNQITQIMTYKVGDLWDRTVINDPSLTPQENKQVVLAGRQLMAGTSTNYKALYSDVDVYMTKAQSDEVDRRARVFISEHRQLEIDDIIAPIAKIPGQEDTYLTVTQEDRIRYIMEIKTKGLWTKAFYTTVQLRDLQGRKLISDGFSQLTKKEKKYIRKAGIELMGDVLYQQFYLEGFIALTQTVQDQIDQKSLEFIAVNKDIKATDEWDEFAKISHMPQTTILEKQYQEIDRLAKIMLPTYWNGWPPTFTDATTDHQKTAVWKMVERIFGEKPAGIGQTWTKINGPNFSEEDQGLMDEQATKFYEKYLDDTEHSLQEKQEIIQVIGTNYVMPLTTLTEVELKKGRDILKKLSGGEWGKYTSDEDINQSRFQFNAARWAGEEWLQDRQMFYRYTEGLKYEKNVGKGVWKDIKNYKNYEGSRDETLHYELLAVTAKVVQGPPTQCEPFDADEQVVIDSNGREFIKKYSDLDLVTSKSPYDAVAIMKFMPLTTITETLDELVDKIMSHRLPNSLWERQFSPEGFKPANQQEQQTLTTRQIEAIDTAGQELFGTADLYNQWKTGQIVITKEQQTVIDKSWIKFKEDYEAMTENQIIQVLATIDKMPLTTITDLEWSQISGILEFRLPVVYPLLAVSTYSELTRQYQKAAYVAWEELFGSTAAVDQWLLVGGPDFVQEDQTDIDSEIQGFLTNFSGNDPADIIKLNAVIEGMPETAIFESEWVVCETLLTRMVGDLWKTYLFNQQSTLSDNQIEGAKKALLRFTGVSGHQDDYATMWKNNLLSKEDQQTISDHATDTFISTWSTEPEPTDIVIKVEADILKLTQTTLFEDEWTEVVKILEYRVSGLNWLDYIRGNEQGIAEAYTSGIVLTELAGGDDELLKKWVDGELIQASIELDDHIKAYIVEYKQDVAAKKESIKLDIDPKADIYFMPGTDLKYSEWIRAEKIANFLTDGLWQDVQENPFGNKLSSESKQLSTLCEMMFGNKEVADLFILKGYMPLTVFQDTVLLWLQFEGETQNKAVAEQKLLLEEGIGQVSQELFLDIIRDSSEGETISKSQIRDHIESNYEWNFSTIIPSHLLEETITAICVYLGQINVTKTILSQLLIQEKSILMEEQSKNFYQQILDSTELESVSFEALYEIMQGYLINTDEDWTKRVAFKESFNLATIASKVRSFVTTYTVENEGDKILKQDVFIWMPYTKESWTQLDDFFQYRVAIKLSEILKDGFPVFSVWKEKVDEVISDMVRVGGVESFEIPTLIKKRSQAFTKDEQTILDYSNQEYIDAYISKLQDDSLILFKQEYVIAYEKAIEAEAAASEASNAKERVNASYLLAQKAQKNDLVEDGAVIASNALSAANEATIELANVGAAAGKALAAQASLPPNSIAEAADRVQQAFNDAMSHVTDAELLNTKTKSIANQLKFAQDAEVAAREAQSALEAVEAQVRAAIAASTAQNYGAVITAAEEASAESIKAGLAKVKATTAQTSLAQILPGHDPTTQRVTAAVTVATAIAQTAVNQVSKAEQFAVLAQTALNKIASETAAETAAKIAAEAVINTAVKTAKDKAGTAVIAANNAKEQAIIATNKVGLGKIVEANAAAGLALGFMVTANADLTLAKLQAVAVANNVAAKSQYDAAINPAQLAVDSAYTEIYQMQATIAAASVPTPPAFNGQAPGTCTDYQDRLLKAYLPLTDISEEEEKSIWEAMNYQTEGEAYCLFKKNKIEGSPILLSEAHRLEQVYDRLFTARGNHFIFDKKQNQQIDLTQPESDTIDEKMRAFITKYSDDDSDDKIELKTIRKKMPHTQISIQDNRKLDQILEWQFGRKYDEGLDNVLKQLFDNVIVGTCTSDCEVSEAINDTVGNENLDKTDYDFLKIQWDYQELIQQETIDAKLQKYIVDKANVLYNDQSIKKTDQVSIKSIADLWNLKCETCLFGNCTPCSCGSLLCKSASDENSGFTVQDLVIIKAISAAKFNNRQLDVFESYESGGSVFIENTDLQKLNTLLNYDDSTRNKNANFDETRFAPIKSGLQALLAQYKDALISGTISPIDPIADYLTTRRLLSQEEETSSTSEPEGSYRKFQKRVKQPWETSAATRRHLQQENRPDCVSEDEIREYMKNKSIIVFATESFVKEEDQEPNKNEVQSYMVPIAEKRLDFRYHKNIGAQIEEQHIEIQDELLQVHNPDPQKIIYTTTSVASEDVSTREYWDGIKGEYVNSQETMISINFELLTTISEQKRTAYSLLSLFGDIGGLFDFLLLFVGPLVGYIVGDRFSYIILRSLYMQNRNGDENADGQQPQGFNSLNPNVTNEQKRLDESLWLHRTEPYKESAQNQILLNSWVQLLTCRGCRKTRFWHCKKTTSEKIYEKGQDRTERALDVRNLIKSQETLKLLLHTVIPSKEKRKLMRLQRRAVVIEPVSSSSDSEDDFTSYKSFYKQFQKNYEHYDERHYGKGDPQHIKLLKGVLDRDALIGKKKQKPQKETVNRRARSQSVKIHVNDQSAHTMNKNDASGLDNTIPPGQLSERVDLLNAFESDKFNHSKTHAIGDNTFSAVSPLGAGNTGLEELADLEDIMTSKK